MFYVMCVLILHQMLILVHILTARRILMQKNKTYK